MYNNPVVFFALMGIVGVLLTWAAVEDWKTNSISGILCWCVIVAITISAVVLKVHPMASILAIVPMVQVGMGIEVPWIGSADFLPIAAYIIFYLGTPAFTYLWWMMYPVVLFFVMFPYAKIYARAHGTTWHFGSKMMMPMIPCFTIAWWTSMFGCFLMFVIKVGGINV